MVEELLPRYVCSYDIICGMCCQLIVCICLLYFIFYKPGSSHRKTDTLLLVPLVQMKSGTYVDFGDGLLTIVNLVMAA